MAYVDGFNLYNGLKEKHGRRFMWLDLQGLTEKLLQPDQTLIEVKYFSARVRNSPDSAMRQDIYLNALRAACDRLEIIEGRFQEKTLTCKKCGHSRTSYEEKETDVSIAVSLVEDAALDRYDTAVIISADSDLCPAVRSARRLGADRRFVAAFPPRRVSDELRKTVDASFTIADQKLRSSLLDATITGASGKIYTRPTTWY
ncbi:MAG: NYN domain-containing protein [Motilibacteraceae bacterium]